MDENPYEPPKVESLAAVPVSRSRVGSWVFFISGLLGALFVIWVVAAATKRVSAPVPGKASWFVGIAVGLFWSGSSFYISRQLRRQTGIEEHNA